MAGALNSTLREVLSRIPNAVLLGEDVEDPKGGVFGFTKGLSTRYPGRVVNSALAEATIAGMGIGLAATGFRPILEMQFIDFIAPAFNQLLNQAATLRWRSNGDWTCPAVFYAPYGAYLPAGSTWHSQSNEGFWTHIPGLARRGAEYACRSGGPAVERHAGIRSHAAARSQAHHACPP